MPVIYNNKIKGLRIHLESKYKLDTTDIWFSSSQEYKGANAKNWMLMLLPKEDTKLELFNNDIKERDVVIASEMLLAYKAYSEYNKITIGLPNTISKKQIKEILSKIKIRQADFYLDLHTLWYHTTPIYDLKDKIGEDKTRIKMIFKDADMTEIKSDNVSEAA